MDNKTSKDSNVKNEYANATFGLNMDNTPNQIENGNLSYALNANLENFDANSVNYQNEEGNEFCLDFPEGYILIGKHLISEKNKHIFFLVNPIEENSQIGYMDDNDCEYKILISASCLNFNMDNPIHKIVHKLTNCSTEIYWTDGLNPRRYVDIDNVPETLKYGSTICDPDYTGEVDCNQLKIQPNFSIPKISYEIVTNGGNLIAGTYQFTVQYSDASGNPYTSYYSITNPIPIADPQITSVNFNYPVGKSIGLLIDELDVSGQFEYFNLAVIKTINAISSVELVGTYNIESDNREITYSGQDVTAIRLSINDIFQKYPYYDIAQDVTVAQDVIIWDDLSSIDRINYQSIANKIHLQWETWRIPSTEDYSDELNAANLRSYLRDEVYPFEIVFELTNGKQTDGFHIPGRAIGFNESQPDVSDTDPDFIGTPNDEGFSPYWKIYNTASVIGQSPEYLEDDEYKGPHQYGEFAYWESSERYPCNKEIWGDLAEQPIRHHKFPDLAISPIFESNHYTAGSEFSPTMGDKAIFPIGVKIDVNTIKNLIATSNLSTVQKNEIAGFKIVRGNRSTNKSIVAKGILRNVGKYSRDDNEYYYPNYPYNDLREDPFLNSINNAYTQLCESYTITITSLGDGDSATVDYKNCDTNKDAEKIYTELTTLNSLCSTIRPIIKSPAIGTVEISNYELWNIWNPNIGLGGSTTFTYIDADEGETSKTLGPTSINTVYVHVEVNTGGVAADGYGLAEYIETVYSENTCNRETPISIIEDDDNRYRQVFNSPETSFGQPILGNVLKLESVIFGGGKAHFTEVKDNAKYKLLTKESQIDAIETAEELGNITSDFDTSAFFTAYEAQLTIMINGMSRKNFAKSFNSIADYNYTIHIPNDLGIKQRNLDTSKYMIPSVVSVGDDINVNNWQRESSIFLKTDEDVDALPYPNDVSSLGGAVTDESRFTISEKSLCGTPAKQEDINVLSYYASIKNSVTNQWGQIYSYETIDTGYQGRFDGESSRNVFGGDTYICRFAFKTKLPFFIDNRVNAPDDSDIFYDEIGNIAYPKYWHSARPITEDYVLDGGGEGGGAYPLSNIISYKAHNFDCPNDQTLALDPEQTSDDEDYPNKTLSADSNPNRTHYDGYYYSFAYGVPNFYCESSYNTDLRQAFNNKEGDFFPHVSTGIPDDWFQENFVSIANDNAYYYNSTFSKQNVENSFTHLPLDWDNPCYTHYPFRAIYSDAQNIDSDNRVNSWLIYKAISYFDFPQNYGALTSLDGIQDKAILARFENKSLLYNNLLTIDTSNPQSAYIGNPRLFKGAPPIDFAETDLGYMGSQHKLLLKIPQGQISIDAKRGQIFLINGTQAIDISGFGSGMNRFFTDNLAFEILRYYPDIDVDNAFSTLGLCGVYDSKYDRIILTKIDYIPVYDNITYEDGDFYFDEVIGDKIASKKVYLTDSEYFCNKSWTLSFSLNTRRWISFHTYLPNFYIAENNFFYTGLRDCCTDFNFIVGIPSEGSNCDLDDGNIEIIPDDTDCTITDASVNVIIPSPTTTTTTTRFIDCTIEDGEILTIEESPCVRPEGMDMITLITGYDILSPSSTVLSTASKEDACSAIDYIDATSPFDISVNGIPAEVVSVSVGNIVYNGHGGTDCECVPDGWYFTVQTMLVDTVFHVVDCVIVQIYICSSTTTTTTTREYECILADATVGTIEYPEICEWDSGTAIVIETGITTTTTTTTTLYPPTTTTSTTTIAPVPTTTTTTTTTSSSTTTSTTTIMQYHMEMCVNDTVYDFANGVDIPYQIENIIDTPLKSGYNYLFFSIPVGTSFTIEDSLGADVTSEFILHTASGNSGVDSRPGYYDNNIYKGADVFATSFSVEYTITLV